MKNQRGILVTEASTFTKPHGSGGTPTRRAIVKGAAWSVPVIAAAVATPIAAATVQPVACPNVTSGAQWTKDAPTTGFFSPYASGNDIWQTLDHGPQAYGYFSDIDGGSFGFGTTYRVWTTFTADPTQVYTFSYSLAGKHAPATESASAQVVRVKVTSGGTTTNVGTYSTDGSFGSQLPMWSGTQTVVPATGTFTIGPGLQGQVTLAYEFDLRPLKKVGTVENAPGRYANDDIWISAPTIECSTY